MTISEFIAKWRKVELKERSAAQEHFLDLCRVFDHPTPAAADPTGESFSFEKGAAKHGGGDGFADVWKRGFFGWEYKGKHKDLSAAFDQLLRYRDALENLWRILFTAAANALAAIAGGTLLLKLYSRFDRRNVYYDDAGDAY